MTALVGIDDIRRARQLVGPVLRATQTEISDNLSRLCGRPMLLKAEHLQRTGSFKIRGAYAAIAPHRGSGSEIVAASAGNHAQGVALAATLCGLTSTIFMPTGAAFPKVEATRSYGGTIVFEGHVLDETIAAAREYAATRRARFIPPFDDPLVIAGQGTCGLEIIEQAPDVEAVVVPVGGGGLISGIAAAYRAERPGVRIVGVEASGAASMLASLDAGEPVTLATVQTMADGIALKAPGPLTLAHVEALVDDIVTVTEDEIGSSLVLLLERAKAVVEPAGAAAVAAVLAGKVPGRGAAAAVLSGGNVDPLLLGHLIERGLSAAGRYLRFRVVTPDRPGSLAAISRTIADQGLNVLDVEHNRASVILGMNEVEIIFTVETRNPDHRDEALDAVRRLGVVVEHLP